VTIWNFATNRYKVFESFSIFKFINQLEFELLCLPMLFLLMQVVQLHLGCDASQKLYQLSILLFIDVQYFRFTAINENSMSF